jgi:hypothetical protein
VTDRLRPLAAKPLADGRVLEVWPMTYGNFRLLVLPFAGSHDADGY